MVNRHANSEIYLNIYSMLREYLEYLEYLYMVILIN